MPSVCHRSVPHVYVQYICESDHARSLEAPRERLPPLARRPTFDVLASDPRRHVSFDSLLGNVPVRSVPSLAPAALGTTPSGLDTGPTALASARASTSLRPRGNSNYHHAVSISHVAYTLDSPCDTVPETFNGHASHIHLNKPSGFQYSTKHTSLKHVAIISRH